MKKLFTLLILLFGVLSSLMAEKVEVNGIYYYLYDTTNTATVTYKGDKYSAYDEYSGDIVIPSSITYNNVTYYVDVIGEEAFHYCKDLKTVTIPYSVTKISQTAFQSCKSLTSVTIANGLQSIGDDAFRDCTALTKISLPNTLRGLGNGVFADCTALEKVSIPMNPNIGQMTFLNYVFSNCQSLKEIELPITSNISQRMFANCINLEKVSLPNTVSISDYAFYSCSALKEIIIPESVKSIGKSAFEGSSITSIVIPNLVTKIGEKAFSNCPLTSINIGSGITTIDVGAFANNTQNYSPKVNYEGTLDSWAGIQFKAATSNPTYYGKDLYIKDELVTEVEISSTNSIKNYAFINCASIKSLKISSNVGSIGERVFEGCSSLSSITSYATAVPATYNNTFAQQYSANLKVLCDVVDAYKAHSIFGNFINIECFTEEGGDDNGNDNTGGEEGGDQGGDQGGDDTGDVEIVEPANLYIIGALTGWAADPTWQFSTANDEYFVLSFPKGQEQELSGLFKVASSNWSPYNYGAPLDLGSVEAGKEYVLEYNVATNLSIANIIKVSKIEFTLSTQTLKITGTTEEKVFDTTSDYGFHIYADYKDYPFTFKGNGVYEYDYTGVGPSTTIGDYQYKTVEWGRNSTGNTVTLGELYQLGLSNHPISFPDAAKGQTLTIVLTVSSDWSATILVKEKSSEEGGDQGGDQGGEVTPPTPTPTPNDITLYYVNSNEWDNVNGYVWPTGGTGILEWPGAPATKIDKTVDGFDVYSYTFDSTKADNIIFNAGLGGAQTKDLLVNAAKPYYYGGVWYETLTFDAVGGDEGGNEGGEEGGDQGEDEGGDDPIVPEISDYVVRGNGGSDATGIWCGGIEWTNDDSPVNNMTDADEDGIYEVTYKNVPAGSWAFKVVGGGAWMGGQYLDITNSSAGVKAETLQIDGNIVFSLSQAADVTIKFNTLTGKIIVTTPSGSFDKPTIEYFHISVGDNLCYDYYEFTEENDYKVMIQRAVIVEEDGVGSVGCTIIGNCNYSAYKEQFYTEVTESGTYNVTVTFNGDYENPDFTLSAKKIEPADKIVDVYIMGGFSGWTANETYKLTSADGDYYVATYPKGKELEISGLFKFASADWSTIDFGKGTFYIDKVEPGRTYMLDRGGSNLETNGKILISKIELVVSEGLFRITGTTVEDKFDLTSDFGISLVEFLNGELTYMPLTFKGNGVYTGTYTYNSLEDELGTILAFPNFKVGGLEDMMTIDYGQTDLKSLELGSPYTLNRGSFYYLPLEIAEYDKLRNGDKLSVTVTFTEDWGATLLMSLTADTPVVPDPNDPVEPETPAYVVRGNGGSDATGIWCGGIEWTSDDSPVNNMTDTDKDGIYEVTYKNVPAGTWNFKVVGATEGWMGSDFLDTKNSSAGCTTAPYDGNIGFTLNAPADVTIKFNTLTGKIIATTPSGSFGKVVIEHFHILTGNNQCLDEFEFTEANNYTLVLTQEVIIDEEYGVAYVGCGILGNCDYAVYEKYFTIEVTESGTYTVTVQFNGDYDNPDFTVTVVKQGGSDEPVVKDPVISDITAPTFPQIEVGETATATLTYTLENATTATASIESDAFYIMSQSVENGEGTVKILFMPEAKGVHTATISIKSGNVTETTMIVAKAVEPAPEVVPAIKNVVIPTFTSIEKGTATSVTATFTLENATDVSATLSGTGKDAFVLGQPELNGGNGSVKIVFMPTEAGTYTATLTLTSGKAVQTATISAVATEPAPQVSITNIQVPAFDEIYVGDFTAINVTYTLENATKSSVSISGTNADAFIAQNNKVTNGKGSLQVIFLPESAGLYTATLTIAAGDVSESVTLVAIAKLEQTEDPGETVVNISNLQVPEFASVVENETTTVIASYVLTGAKDATARISGTDAKYFTILSQKVSEGVGQVEIEFAPNAARTFNATLTIISGTESESIDFSASALAAPVISNIQVPEFAETYVDETQTVLATYTLENAEAATATLSGDVEVFSISKQILSGGNGLVRIDFAPKSKGTYRATLIITSGKVTESVNFSATAIVEETEELPIISNLNVPAFDEVYEGESAIVIATYTLENATEATATLSGDDVFSILRSLNGKVLIEFAPAEAGTYNGTLTITSGKVSESINFSAEAVKEGGEEPGPGPIEPEKPDPLPSYPVRGYMYVVNTPNADLESMVKYRPVSDDKVDYFLAPEKTGQKIYGYDIYKFEVRDDEKIDLWEYPNDRYTSWHINVNADLSATPYRANGVWYASIEEMMTWYVSYIPNWDDEASEVMIEESPGVYVATFDAFAESDDDDKYYYCLGNVENPILEVGVSEYGVIQNYLQIPQGFKAMIYLDDTNWETEWKTYYKLVPPGKDWNRDCIDLGLTSGLCWATKNLGATEPQQEGTHFAWGEVEPKEDYSYNTYKWANLLKNNEYIKYVTDDYWGTIVDFRTTLEPTDDAANVALEGKWHMPTQADVEELLRECTTEFGSYYGVNGYFVTGPNGNAIFLPAVGIKEGTGYEESTRGGDYWTSSLYEDNQAYAVTLSFALTYIEIDDMRRTNGLAIRPVIHKDYVGIEEVVAINVYAKDHTIYCEEPFQIYTVTGLEVTHLNGALEGVYIVKTAEGNRLVSVW